jgi:hypothetical protein
MLSIVLWSRRAVLMNCQTMRAFIRPKSLKGELDFPGQSDPGAEPGIPLLGNPSRIEYTFGVNSRDKAYQTA